MKEGITSRTDMHDDDVESIKSSAIGIWEIWKCCIGSRSMIAAIGAIAYHGVNQVGVSSGEEPGRLRVLGDKTFILISYHLAMVLNVCLR